MHHFERNSVGQNIIYVYSRPINALVTALYVGKFFNDYHLSKSLNDFRTTAACKNGWEHFTTNPKTVCTVGL